MQPQKVQKIDLSETYPCPCRRRGHLAPIVLTEAFGCDRCQQIFVVEESGYSLEELSTTYPYKRVWQWTGREWSTQRGWGSQPMALVILLVLSPLLLLWLALVLNAPLGREMILWSVITLMLALVLVAMVWLALSRYS